MRLATFLWSIENYMLPCLTKKFLGHDCPGCGLQRSALLLIKGHFVEAFQMYPAIYPMLLLLGFLVLKKLVNVPHENTVTFVLLLVTALFILTNFILKFL